ncbi:hypothetical protein MASR2M78_25250 [Treponema sp.]
MHVHKGIALLVLCTFSFMSCASTVRFRTNAEDAELRINDRYYGSMPTTVKLSNFVFNTYRVDIEAPGYEDYSGPIDKSVKVVPLVFGIFYFFPLLWAYGPSNRQNFVLREKTGPLAGKLVSAKAPSQDKVAQGKASLQSVGILEFKLEKGAENTGLSGRDFALLMETYLSSYDRFELKDRLYLSDLLQEKELQSTDLFDPAFTANLGSLKGPKGVLIGQVKKIGDGLSVFVKIVDVESGSQSRVFERSDIFVGSQGVNALKEALKSIASDINVYYLARS